MRPTVLVSLLLVSIHTQPVAAQIPDFAATGDEAVQLLQNLIRIDTSNPPGNETLVAEHVNQVLAEEGIDSDIYALDPARGNLVARLPGNGSKDPVLILAHSDVVGVEEDLWTVDAFSGEILDDYIYGRGASLGINFEVQHGLGN